MVAGGLLEMSYTTRLTPRTSLMIRLLIVASTSNGIRAQSAVMKSCDSTARIAQTLSSTELDLAEGAGYSNERTETLLRLFDEAVRKSREAIATAKQSDYDVPWSLKMRGNVLFTAPRGEVVRQHISHLSHHRGQMTVYLRLLDVPVPSIYGPTADEKWGS